VPALLITRPIRISGVSSRAVGAEPDVEAGGELERAADTDAVDRGDRRHGGRQHDARHAREGIDGGRPGRLLCLDRRPEVVAGGVVLAGAAKYDAAGLRVVSRRASIASATPT
jgi:hypothetical protein